MTNEVLQQLDNGFYLFKMSLQSVEIDNGCIIHTKGITLELENDLLYAVEGEKYDMFGNVKWERTGKVMTPQQLNEL